MRRISFWSGVALALLVFPARAQEPVPDRELIEELESAPVENPERVRRLRELYLQAGARPEEVRLQEVKAGPESATLQNVIVTKPGETDAVIVVGGHLDKVPPGRGVIDDWSGACLAANLYQTFRAVPTRHTFVFVGFAFEERGLLGSRAYVASLTEEQRGKVRAMINLECLGVADTLIWTNGSTDRLEALAHRVAQDARLPLGDHVLENVGADSIPFDRVGIPVLTFDGLPEDRFGLIHSERDVFANVRPDCYRRTYRLVSRFLSALDREGAEAEGR